MLVKRCCSRWLFLFLFCGQLLAAEVDFKTLRAQAEAGDAYAQLNLGAAYDHATGEKRDIPFVDRSAGHPWYYDQDERSDKSFH